MAAARILLASVLAVFGLGCQANELSSALSRFARDGRQEDLDVLDRGDYEGALLLIGILDSGARWELRDGWIDVALVRMMVSESSPKRTSRDSFVPLKVHMNSWILRNPYVLDWAEERLKSSGGKNPPKK